jgi:hypothetical protein
VQLLLQLIRQVLREPIAAAGINSATERADNRDDDEQLDQREAAAATEYIGPAEDRRRQKVRLIVLPFEARGSSEPRICSVGAPSGIEPLTSTRTTLQSRDSRRD